MPVTESSDVYYPRGTLNPERQGCCPAVEKARPGAGAGLHPG